MSDGGEMVCHFFGRFHPFRFLDSFRDPLRDLWDYGVADGAYSMLVCPTSYPIIHSKSLTGGL